MSQKLMMSSIFQKLLNSSIFRISVIFCFQLCQNKADILNIRNYGIAHASHYLTLPICLSVCPSKLTDSACSFFLLLQDFLRASEVPHQFPVRNFMSVQVQNCKMIYFFKTNIYLKLLSTIPLSLSDFLQAMPVRLQGIKQPECRQSLLRPDQCQ